MINPPTPDMNSPSEFVKAQINKPTEDSKKWKMAIIGLKGIAGFFIVGTAMFVFRPAIAPTMTTMVQVAMTAWGGIIGIYLGAQGTVEYKATAAIQSLNENKNETTKTEEHKTVDVHVVEGKPGDSKPWSPVAATP